MDIGVIWKGIMPWVCMSNVKSLSLNVQKSYRRVKVDGQKNKQPGQSRGTINVILILMHYWLVYSGLLYVYVFSIGTIYIQNLFQSILMILRRLHISKAGLNNEICANPKWERPRWPEMWASPVGMLHPSQIFYGNQSDSMKRSSMITKIRSVLTSWASIISYRRRVSLYMVMIQNAI